MSPLQCIQTVNSGSNSMVIMDDICMWPPQASCWDCGITYRRIDIAHRYDTVHWIQLAIPLRRQRIGIRSDRTNLLVDPSIVVTRLLHRNLFVDLGLLTSSHYVEIPSSFGPWRIARARILFTPCISVGDSNDLPIGIRHESRNYPKLVQIEHAVMQRSCGKVVSGCGVRQNLSGHWSRC